MIAVLSFPPNNVLDDPDMEIIERLARLEAKWEAIDEKVDRNREEAEHDRNNLKVAMEQLGSMVTEHNDKLSNLFSILDQAKGAKKTIWGVFGALSFFGLAGIYQVLTWLGFVKAH